MDVPVLLSPGGSREATRANHSAFDRSLYAERESVAWHHDPAREMWELEKGAPAAPAPDWFFVVGHPRTGTTVASELLSLHPDVYCGDEHHVLPLFMSVLGAPTFFAPRLWYAARYQKQIRIEARNMRRLMEAWRRCVSEKPLFGDKGDMYYERFGDACAGVFPGCRFILTLRRPLDTLASYARQDWSGWLNRGDDPDALYAGLRQRAYVMLQRNGDWKDHAATLVFEEFATREGFEAGFRRALAHLGVDADRFDWDAGWSRCRHAPATGRAANDPLIRGFLAWLERTDAPLGEILRAGSYQLPDGKVVPAEFALAPLHSVTSSPRG